MGTIVILLGLGWLVLGAEDPITLESSGELAVPVSTADLPIEASIEFDEPEEVAEVERESIQERPLRVRVLKARTLEPVVGASVEIRSGDPKFAEARALLGPEHLRVLPSDDGRMIISSTSQMSFASEFRNMLVTKGGKTLSEAMSGKGGWAELVRSPLGTHLWAEKAGANGWTKSLSSADEVTLYIERPICIQVLDTSGIAQKHAQIKVSLQLGQSSVKARPPSPMGNGDAIVIGLWSALRKELDEGSHGSGILLELEGRLGGDSVFLPREQEPPPVVHLREAPTGSFEIRMPWIKSEFENHLRVSLREQGSRMTYSRVKPPYHYERIPLGLKFDLTMRLQDRPVHQEEVKGPTEPNQKVILEISQPKELLFLRGFVRISVEGEVRTPSSQSALVVMADGIENRASLGSEGELLLSLPLLHEVGDSVQLWMEEDGSWYRSAIMQLQEEQDKTLDLGEVLLTKSMPLVSLEVRNEFGELLLDAGVAVQKAVFEGGVRKWRMCSSVRIRRDEESGVIEIHGPSVLQLFRFRVQDLASYPDGKWVECRPGSGVISVTMRSTR